MAIDSFLLGLCVLIGLLCFAAIVTVLLEIRAIRRRQRWEHVSPRPESGVRSEELQNLLHETRSIRDGLERMKLSLDRLAMSGRPDVVTSPGSMGIVRTVPPLVEGPQQLTADEAARRLVEECDSKPVERLADVPDWVREHGYALELVAGAPEDWFLAVLASAEGYGLVVPNMRRPMGTVDLGRFFDLVNYNGFDPLRKEKVGDFARVIRVGKDWSVTRKGIIQG